MLSIHELQKNFGDVIAVDNVSFDVVSGECLGVVGPNGAGKTTTILCALGLTSPTLGEIHIDGVNVHQHRRRALRNVGFMAGYAPLNMNITVRRLLKHFAILASVKDPDTHVDRAIELLQIPHLEKRLAPRLSSGQKTLVNVARAIVHKPKLLVLDEPTAFTDPQVSLRVNDVIRKVKEEGTAILLTSHDMVEVERVCDRIIFIAQGSIRANVEIAHIEKEFGHDDLEKIWLEIAATEKKEEL